MKGIIRLDGERRRRFATAQGSEINGGVRGTDDPDTSRLMRHYLIQRKEFLGANERSAMVVGNRSPKPQKPDIEVRRCIVFRRKIVKRSDYDDQLGVLAFGSDPVDHAAHPRLLGDIEECP